MNDQQPRRRRFGPLLIIVAAVALASCGVPTVQPAPPTTASVVPASATLAQQPRTATPPSAPTSRAPTPSGLGPTPNFDGVPHQDAGAGVLVFRTTNFSGPWAIAIYDFWYEFATGLQVYAGNASDPQQGAVAILAPGEDVYHPEVYLTPLRVGGVQIIGAAGERLVLQTLDKRLTFNFDVPTRQFVDSLTATVTAATVTPFTVSATPLPSTRSSPPTAAAAPLPTATGAPIARLTAGRLVTLTTMHMIDATTGWATTRDAAGVDHILRTTDGGAGWRDVSPSETSIINPPESGWPPASLSDFLDGNTAWVSYWADPQQFHTIWRTRDGGQTWSKSQAIPMIVHSPGLPTHLMFIDAQTGWLFVAVSACGTGGCDDHVLFVTGDGGLTWQPVGRTYEGGMSACSKTSLTFVTAQRGWVGGDCSMALVYLLQRTDDGGRTWHDQALPPPPGEPNLLDFSQSAGCRAAGPAFSSGRMGVLDIYCPWPKDYSVRHWLYVTSDGGRTWAARRPPVDLGAAVFVSDTTGWWLAGDPSANPAQAALYETVDGGINWTLIKRLGWSGRLDFISPQLGWAVARADEVVALVRTIDGGRAWEVLKPQIVP